MAPKIKYTSYSLFDFLLDPSFKQWVQNPTVALDEYWQSVIKENPDQYDTIQKAIKTIRHLPELDQQIHERGRDALWQRIDKALDIVPLSRPKPKFDYFKYAAAIFVILGVVLAAWLYQKNTALVYVASGNGESKSVVLPDGSKVYLGPNSSIYYSKNLAENAQREVWAAGDARFNIKHINKNPKAIKNGERFVVHLDKKIAVEVLGTVFNVSSRRGTSLVELLSGSVKVSRNEKYVLLKPGERVNTGKNGEQLTVSTQQLHLIREWEQQTVILNRTSISQIINLVKDTYGIDLKIDNTAILNKEIDGVLPLNDREKALQILASITGTSVDEKNGIYLLKEIR